MSVVYGSFVLHGCTGLSIVVYESGQGTALHGPPSWLILLWLLDLSALVALACGKRRAGLRDPRAVHGWAEGATGVGKKVYPRVISCGAAIISCTGVCVAKYAACRQARIFAPFLSCNPVSRALGLSTSGHGPPSLTGYIKNRLHTGPLFRPLFFTAVYPNLTKSRQNFFFSLHHLPL